jgi:hypothetical protein
MELDKKHSARPLPDCSPVSVVQVINGQGGDNLSEQLRCFY